MLYTTKIIIKIVFDMCSERAIPNGGYVHVGLH